MAPVKVAQAQVVNHGCTATKLGWARGDLCAEEAAAGDSSVPSDAERSS
jgi:hypothetical protein